MGNPTDSENEPVSGDERSQTAPRERTARGLVLSWKMQNFWVPADAVVSLPKTPYVMPDGAALGALLSTKDPAKWYDVCKPEHMLMLKGKEGTSVYAIMSVEGQPNEERFIRHVIAPVCAKNFPKVFAEIEADPARAAPTSERQRKRLEVLQWKPGDCTANQLDPKHNDWTPCSEEGLKSCKIDPTPSHHRPAKRSLSADMCAESDAMPTGVKFIKSIEVNQDLGYHVHQRPNAVVVVQFEAAGANRAVVEA